MASLDFYATVDDHERLLTYLFEQGEVRVFESYSAFDRELMEFTKADQILGALRHAGDPQLPLLLQLWAPAASMKVEIERFSLSIPEHSHRHRIAGWGLMQLDLSKETDAEIHPSHFGHFNQRAAEKWSETSPAPNPGTAAEWHWPRRQHTSR